jgi:hypothetical protein
LNRICRERNCPKEQFLPSTDSKKLPKLFRINTNRRRQGERFWPLLAVFPAFLAKFSRKERIFDGFLPSDWHARSIRG